MRALVVEILVLVIGFGWIFSGSSGCFGYLEYNSLFHQDADRLDKS